MPSPDPMSARLRTVVFPVAGLGTAERQSLAEDRAQAVIDRYGTLLTAGGEAPRIAAQPAGDGLFEVRVTYDMTAHPIRRYAAIMPLPSPTMTASVLVTNGGY